MKSPSKTNPRGSASRQPKTCEIFILAGGLSTRMGRDKAKVKLGEQTLLNQIRSVAAQLNLPVRVIRKDAVPRCGVLGGIYTALKRSRADALLFLACDMPFVSVELLRRLTAKANTGMAWFTMGTKGVGFPFLLRREFALPIVAQQIVEKRFSLQALAKILRAKTITPAHIDQTFNINTPAELKIAVKKMARRTLKSSRE